MKLIINEIKVAVAHEVGNNVCHYIWCQVANNSKEPRLHQILRNIFIEVSGMRFPILGYTNTPAFGILHGIKKLK